MEAGGDAAELALTVEPFLSGINEPTYNGLGGLYFLLGCLDGEACLGIGDDLIYGEGGDSGFAYQTVSGQSQVATVVSF